MNLGEEYLRKTAYERNHCNEIDWADLMTNDDDFWTMKTGVKILIKNMDDSHLINSIRMMERNNFDVIRIGGGYTWDTESLWYDEEPNPKYEKMIKEAMNRGINV